MIGRPQPNEAASSYSTYIDRVTSDDIVSVLATQLAETVAFLSAISEEQSLKRYAPDKWSMRQLLGHVNDGERVFMYRAMWFARGFQDPLPSFDQEIGFKAADSDNVSWSSHIDEFRAIRSSTLAFFRISRPMPGCAAASPATTRSQSALLPTLLPGTSRIMWAFCASDTCEGREVRGQRSEIRGQRSEIRGRRSEVRSQIRSEVADL